MDFCTIGELIKTLQKMPEDLAVYILIQSELSPVSAISVLQGKDDGDHVCAISFAGGLQPEDLEDILGRGSDTIN